MITTRRQRTTRTIDLRDGVAPRRRHRDRHGARIVFLVLLVHLVAIAGVLALAATVLAPP